MELFPPLDEDLVQVAHDPHPRVEDLRAPASVVLVLLAHRRQSVRDRLPVDPDGSSGLFGRAPITEPADRVLERFVRERALEETQPALVFAGGCLALGAELVQKFLREKARMLLVNRSGVHLRLQAGPVLVEFLRDGPNEGLRLAPDLPQVHRPLDASGR
ncbi:MAG: hypothetical protein E6K18_06615 [Methanobacteriota archaeon]|nr:MAG: hypothetical protein E6K18_06615 [Euryarchaeota archaeon]